VQRINVPVSKQVAFEWHSKHGKGGEGGCQGLCGQTTAGDS
jgi:hypothetical protein